MSKLTPHDHLMAVHVWISRHLEYSVLSPLTQVGESKISDKVPTASTDGWNKYYNPDFFMGMPREQRRFLVLHELSHQSRMHMTLMQDLHRINPLMANIAMDFSINGDLIAMDNGRNEIVMPPGGCYDEKYKGWDVRRIFRDLMQEQEGGAPPPKGGGFDSHEFGGEGNGSGEAGGKPDEQTVAAKVAEAIQQGKVLSEKLNKLAGSSAGDRNALLDSLLEPQIDWKAELAEFVQTYCAGTDESTWRKPNRRYLAEDIYMPSLYSEKITKLVIGFDTSGSCFGGAEMQGFASEMGAIIERLKPEIVVVAYVDTRVAGHQEFNDGQFAVQDMRAAGGGGTHLPVLYPWMEEHKHMDAQAIVWFSDGYTDFGTAPPIPVLWCMSSDIKAPYGRTLQIKV